MSVLSIIQDHCKLHALAVPTSVIGSTDTQIIQLLAILSNVLDEICTESKFQVVTYEAVFPAIAAEDQGSMFTLAPNGYYAANFETFYDRTLGRPLYGPLNDTEWQQIKALPNPGPFYQFRILNNHLLLNPAPTAPLSTIAFEYMSEWLVQSAAGAPKSGITLDTDIFALPEKIIKRFVTARWKQIKGLPYQIDEKAAYDLLNNYIAKDKVKRRINVGGNTPQIQPGIYVPAGNWNV